MRTVNGFVVTFTRMLGTLALGLLLLPPLARAQSDDPVLFALSGRHMSATTEELESLAGGRSQLIQKLLSYRTMESPPFAAIRAEKLLLGYSDDPQVRQALEEDVQSQQYTGLARIVAVHIDKVENADARRSLARLALNRARQDALFRTYTKSFAESTDAQVRELARSTE